MQPTSQTGKPGKSRNPDNIQPIEAAALPGALLTARTVSAVLGLSVATIYRLAAAGDLKRVRMGKRCTRWRSADVQAFMARQS